MSPVLILALLASVLCDHCGPWTAIDLNLDVPTARPDDTIMVYYMCAPLLYCDYLDELTYINGYHGGLGLINTRTNVSITVNFDGFPSFAAAFLPIMKQLSNGSFSLDWQNGGKTFIYAGINNTYWHSLQRHVYNMTGGQFNHFRTWLSKANDTFLFYNPWFVYSDFPSAPVLSGYECFQFTFNALQEIGKLGATLVPGVVSLPVSLGTAYTKSAATKIDFFDPIWRNKITNFYLMLEEKWDTLGYLGFVEELILILMTGDFFIRQDNDYYIVEISWPIFFDALD